MKLFFGFLAMAAALVLADKRGKRSRSSRSSQCRAPRSDRAARDDSAADQMRSDDMWRAANACTSMFESSCCSY